MIDRYTRAVLTVIAAALVVIATRGQILETPAHAADEIRCTVEGPIEIKSFGDDLEVKVGNEVKVEIDQAYSSAGSSSSSPLYIKATD